MARHGKRVRENRKLADKSDRHEFAEAIDLLRKASAAKFDETVDVAIRLGVDPKHSDQMVRGAVLLPHGTGKKVRVLVFAKGEKEKEARDAGADYVGAEDMIEKIKGGWLEFDKTIATPDMMREVGKIGRILGTRGLMPNPKVGTVTKDIAKAVDETKKGRVEFRVDKAGNVHAGIGKMSFDNDKLKANFMAVVEQLIKLKPAAAKGVYFKSIALTTTMGPGVRIDPVKTQAELQ